MRICFDLDDTLCYGKPYEIAQPIPGRADLLRELRSEGHVIIISTARFMSTCNSNIGEVIKEVGMLTLEQLDLWDFEYDEIHFGKPSADLYVDDKAFHVSCMANIKNVLNVIQAQKDAIDYNVKTQCDKIQKLVEKIDLMQEK